MIITETRQRIIELISDYMDKTLSEGCLINLGVEKRDLCIISGLEFFLEERNSKYSPTGKWCELLVRYIEKNGDNFFDNQIITGGVDGDNIKDITDHIIGHYDITALLKYLHIKLFIEFYDDRIIHFEDVKGFKYNIPNKPLHLYTEKEDLELLNLLIKLK